MAARWPRSEGPRSGRGRAPPATARLSCEFSPWSSVHRGVDSFLRRPQRAALAVGAYGEDLGEDRERRLLLRVGSDVEAARARDPVERVLGDAGLEQALAATLLVPARAECADVEGLGLERALQRRL